MGSCSNLSVDGKEPTRTGKKKTWAPLIGLHWLVWVLTYLIAKWVNSVFHMVSLQKETLQCCCTVATLKSLPLAFPIWALIPSKYWQSTQWFFFFLHTLKLPAFSMCSWGSPQQPLSHFALVWWLDWDVNALWAFSKRIWFRQISPLDYTIPTYSQHICCKRMK